MSSLLAKYYNPVTFDAPAWVSEENGYSAGENNNNESISYPWIRVNDK